MGEVNFKKIESKWQKRWDEKKVFEAKQDKNKEKFYVLEMYPYPSSSGLHMGHAFNYTIGDVLARFKRMNGFNVLYPMGYDSFGLPAENAAIKAKKHPRDSTNEAIKNYIRQQKDLGLSYDWERKLMSHDENYYKWNQFFFLKFLEKGLVYRKKSPVNWCPECNTVLANEQVQGGKCWRHENTDVETKHLEQWFIKTTDYAEELLDCVDDLQWPERIKLMQKNWIGKSYGTEIDFEVEKSENEISNVVIVHGSPKEDRTKEKDYILDSEKAWIGWAKKELGKKKINCICPQMPIPWNPKYSEWKKEFEKIKIDENSILIGTSAGGGFLVRWLGETKKKIKKLILVSPGKVGNSDRLKEFYGDKLYTEIKDLVKEKIVIYTSKDDLDYHIKGAKEYEKELDGRLIIFEKGYGHFTSKTLVSKEFPELLDEILSKQKFPIFTTRPDTIFGVTFMVISAQHPKLMELVTDEQKKEVEKFLKKIKSVSEKDQEVLEKEGVFTGSYAINPLTNEKIPIWAGNFVVADYGSGMVMAVPAHDQRDFEFAKKYSIDIKEVIQPSEEKNPAGVSAIIETKKGTFLFHERDNNTKVSPNKIGLFGGSIEKKETSLDAIKRELKEELNLECANIKFIGKVDSPYGDKFHNIFYLKDIDKNKLTLNEGRSIIECSLKNLSKNPKSTDFAKRAVDYFIDNKEKAYTGEGNLINSEEFDGLNNQEAKEKITKFLEKKKLGRKKVQFKLRDWLISRQRYWGTPIPIIYCDKCKKQVEEDALELHFYDSEFFDKIKNGEKIIETRALNTTEKDKKFYGDVKERDYLKCVNKITNEIIYLEVLNVTNYKDLESVFKDKQLLSKFSEKINSIKDLEDMYSRFADDYLDRIKKNGLVAWDIRRVTPGIVPVPEKDLPVKLPMDVKFGKGNPLATNEKFVNVKCPTCGGKARREIDTMDTFVDSSWYYMRYADNKNERKFFDKKNMDYWLPVDQYIGGAEHACLHLLYARFWTKALRDLGYVDFDEPFTKLFNQGMLHGEDGDKMSKSKGNVVLPETVSEKYGIDTARLFLMSVASPDKDLNWSEKGIEGSARFVKKIMNYFDNVKIGKSDAKMESKLNKAIKEVTKDIGNFKYNFAVIKIRNLFNSFGEEESKDVLEKSLKLLHPFCPHITEEMWEKLGCSNKIRTSSSKNRERNKKLITSEKWPVVEEKKINEKFDKQEEMIKKLNSDIEKIKKLTGKNSAKVYVYVLPNELEIYKDVEEINLFAVNDKKKYDPENKSKKVKPNKPGIYLE